MLLFVNDIYQTDDIGKWGYLRERERERKWNNFWGKLLRFKERKEKILFEYFEE